jgi:NitT/TauT family transport system permease protein
LQKNIRRFGFLFFVLLMWEVIARLQIWPQFLFPAPEQVFEVIGQRILDGSMLLAILGSMKRLAIGFTIAAGIGLPLGLLMARVKFVQDTLGTVTLGLQALPSICWLPLAILWIGLNESAIIFVVVMGALFSITTAAEAGASNVPPIYIRAARTMGAGGFRMFREVMLPAALPSIIEGMRQGWSFAWRSLMAGELLYASVGLGQMLTMGRELNDMAQVIGVMLVIIAIGILVDRLLFAQLNYRVRRSWGLLRA